MPYPNYHAARIKDPSLFKEIVVLKTTDDGIMIYGGQLKSGGSDSEAQAYRFPKDKYTAQQAKSWLSKYNIKYIMFEPAQSTNLKESKESTMGTIDLSLLIDLSESNVDRNTRVISNAVILSPISRDKSGNVRRKYTDNALNSAVSALEGAASFPQHEKKPLSEPRDPMKALGVYKGVHLSGGKVRGNLHVFAGVDGDKMLSIAEAAPHLIGNSIHAAGRGRKENGIEIVEEIFSFTKYGTPSTVDTVPNPATTVNLFEDSNGDNPENNNPNNQNRRVKTMDIMEATFDDFKSKRPDIMAMLDKSDEIKTLKESNEQLTTENSALKKENDEFKVKAAMSDKVALMESLISAAKLPAELITETFKEDLLNVSESTGADGKVITVESKMKARINDRAALQKGVKNMGSGKVINVFESKSNEQKPDYNNLSRHDLKRIFTRTY
jgi:hypothetical protein